MFNILATCSMLCFALPAPQASRQAGANSSKKLIEFGWDEPDTAFMREHIVEMEKTPFNGCVFHLNYKNEDGSTGNFTWECWGQKRFTEEQLKDAVDDLKNTPFKRFTHNFLRFNVTPGDVDWFDDFSTILSNAKLAAKVAKQVPIRASDGIHRDSFGSGVKGILFDIEQYNSALFNYSQLRDSFTKSFAEYAQQVRKRGKELMEAFQSEYPNIVIFLTFGYCLPWAQMGGQKKLEEVHYGLLTPLLDGMVDGANGESVIVDGCELAYSYKDTSRFAKTYKMMTEDVLKIVANPEKYKSVFSFGFGVWMDNNWRRSGWDIENFENNFYTPEAFEATVRTAIKTTDEYVWIYTETPRWWTASGQPAKLPQEYVQAVLRALESE
jgi:hypothetical protein